MKQSRPLLGAEFTACNECKLFQSCRSYKIAGTGEAKLGLALVGEAPGADEDAKGLPFVGDAGRLLTSLLTRSGVRREDVFTTNAVKCRPTENGKNRTPTPKEVAHCSEFLEEELKRVRPRVVVALGNTAIKTLLGMSGVERLRGRDFQSDRFACRVVPTYHPAAALYAGVRRGGADIERAIVKDIRLAVSIAQKTVGSGVAAKEDYRLIDKIEEAKEVVALLETNVGRTSFDFEGTSTQPLLNTPIGIAFSWKRGTGAYIPLVRGSAFGPVEFWKDAQAEVKELIRRALLSSARKVGHFMKYDLSVAKVSFGVDVAHADFDTGMAHHLLNENADHDLGSLAAEFTTLGQYKRNIEQYAGRRGSAKYNLAAAPLEELAV